jgi:small subunit ribosomal protein S6e
MMGDIMKIVISDKGLSYSVEVAKEREPLLYGMKIGDTFDGSIIGAAGYKFKITGGSDKDGFPMRADVVSTGKMKMLLSEGAGYRASKKGERKKKMIRGSIVSEAISQLNVIGIETGPTPLSELFKKAEGENKEKK